MGRYDLFRPVKSGRVGRPDVDVNLKLMATLGKMNVSYTDTRLLFAGIDVPPPAEKTLQSWANKVSAVYKEANEQTMADNCEMLKFVQRVTETFQVIVMIDTVYNNSPKGRGFYQPGTQSFTPLIDAVTGLVLAVIAFNKVCSRNCDGVCENCTANFAKHLSMDKSEEFATKTNIQAVLDKGLKITHVLADGSHRIRQVLQAIAKELGVKIEKLECLVHRNRSLRRHFYSLSFSVRLVGREDSPEHNYKKAALVEALAARCCSELIRAKQKFGNDIGAFQLFMVQSRYNILDCFQGHHDNCELLSLVCKGKCDTPPRYLPNSEYINPTAKDIILLKDCINRVLGDNYILECRYGLSTNKVEALHHRTLKLLPKTKLYKLNFSGRNHSAMQNASIGLVQSLKVATEKLGTQHKSSKTEQFFRNLEKVNANKRKISKMKLYFHPAGFSKTFSEINPESDR